MQMDTYATAPLYTRAVRRESKAARAAFFAHCLNMPGGLLPHERVPCVCCGQGGPGDWCNTCQIRGNHMGRYAGMDHMITTVCNACARDDVKCTVCGVRPSEGPSEEEASAAALASGRSRSVVIDGVTVEVAGLAM